MKGLKIVSGSLLLGTFIVLPITVLAVKESEKEKSQNGIVIGAKAFPEGLILGNIENKMIEHWTDIYTEFKPGIDGNLAPNLFNNGNIDSIAEYSGSIYDNYWKKPPKGLEKTDVDKFTLDDYNNHLKEFESTKNLKIIMGNELKKGIGFTNSYVLVSKKNDFPNVNSLNELFAQSGKIGLSSNVFTGSGILNKLLDISEGKPYDGNTDHFESKNRLESKGWTLRQIDQESNKYNLLSKTGDSGIDIALGYGTDATLSPKNTTAQFKALNLSDMNDNFVSYEAAFLVRDNKLEQYNDIKLKNNKQSSLLKVIEAIKISQDEMIQMNFDLSFGYDDPSTPEVESTKKTASQIADIFLKSHNYFEDNL
ncbi:MAG: hypothetical protein HRT99_03195 [Mycoplasmatales bacterium]|nr:hypothetical protein [Mycoplasmatales bacterium]